MFSPSDNKSQFMVSFQPLFKTPSLPKTFVSKLLILPIKLCASLLEFLYTSILDNFFAGLFLKSAAHPLISNDPKTTAPFGGVSAFIVNPDDFAPLTSL